MVPPLNPSTTLEYSARCLPNLQSDIRCPIGDAKYHLQRINTRQTRAGTNHRREVARHRLNPAHNTATNNAARARREAPDNRTQRNSGITYVDKLRAKQLTPTIITTQDILLITARPVNPSLYLRGRLIPHCGRSEGT